MKTITEYINESLVNESKTFKNEVILKDLEKIKKWNKAENIKKLMAEYMSAGDAEDLDPKHWEACEYAVKEIINGIEIFIESYAKEGTTDINELSEWFSDTFDDADELVDDLNDMDKEGDWDEDGIINLFNTVSQKVCRTIWLID